MGDSAQGLHARLLDMPGRSASICLQMEENRASGWVNPYRCDDGDVIRRFLVLRMLLPSFVRRSYVISKDRPSSCL